MLKNLLLKDEKTFMLMDVEGNVKHGEYYGLYYSDMRYFSQLENRIDSEVIIPLSVKVDKNLLTSISTNKHSEVGVWRESIEVRKEAFVYGGVYYEKVILTNFFRNAINFDFSYHFDADFEDIFLIRGFERGNLGSQNPVKIESNGVSYEYHGFDNRVYSLDVKFDRQPKILDKNSALFSLALEPQESCEIIMTGSPNKERVIEYIEAKKGMSHKFETFCGEFPKVVSSNKGFEKFYSRSIENFNVLVTQVGENSCLVAGVPWFAVPFGRDSLITALQLLKFNPTIAKGTIRTMAQYQSKEENTWVDANVGKIMHELRTGELATSKQVPFGPYYGSVDSTPLFIILATEYLLQTQDRSFYEEIRPNLEAALTWCDSFKAKNSDGFLTYHRELAQGISNQGWKDSADSNIHSDGSLAQTPIALVEVQGYLGYAKQQLAKIFQWVGEEKKASELQKEVNQLNQTIAEKFWISREYLAIAVDKDKKVDSITSNPGHLLFTESLVGDKEQKVVKKLFDSTLFTLHGIRTMAEGERGYNPMSYHDGSIWPHDNSLTLMGLSKRGYVNEKLQLIEALFNASKHYENYELPELYCGYKTEMVPYPVACSPQAWAAGVSVVCVQSLLGFEIDSAQKCIMLSPSLIDELIDLKVSDIKIGSGILSISIDRNEDKVVCSILENSTGYKVIIK